VNNSLKSLISPFNNDSMDLVEAYLWLDRPPVTEDIESLDLNNGVAKAYEIRLSEAMGLIKLTTDSLNLSFKILKGRLGESFISIPHKGQSTGDVKSFARITDLDGYVDEVIQKLSHQDYVRQVSFMHGYGEGVFVELTYKGKEPYVYGSNQRTILGRDIRTITKNFLVTSSPIVKKVI
jgi:hypothetical protein